MTVFVFYAVTFDSIKIQACQTHQNYLLNLIFVKDIHVLCKTITRNGPKRVIFEVYYDFLQYRRYLLTNMFIWLTMTNWLFTIRLASTQLHSQFYNALFAVLQNILKSFQQRALLFLGFCFVLGKTAATAAISLAFLFAEMLCYVLGRLYSSCVIYTKIGLHR